MVREGNVDWNTDSVGHCTCNQKQKK